MSHPHTQTRCSCLAQDAQIHENSTKSADFLADYTQQFKAKYTLGQIQFMMAMSGVRTIENLVQRELDIKAYRTAVNMDKYNNDHTWQTLSTSIMDTDQYDIPHFDLDRWCP